MSNKSLKQCYVQAKKLKLVQDFIELLDNELEPLV
ncbi:sporulation histidine kinase inhibitor Sda [Fictibacillus terranigra]